MDDSDARDVAEISILPIPELDSGTPSLSEYAPGFLERRRGEWAPRTYQTVEGVLRLYLLPHFGDRRLDTITRREVLAWHRTVCAHRSPRTAKQALAWLAAILDEFAFDFESELPSWSNPARLPRRMVAKDEAGKRHRDKAAQGLLRFTSEEAHALITSRRIPRLRRVYYAISSYTGLRVCEICPLRWEDIEERPGAWGIVVARSSSARILRAGTKTQDRLDVPVHPVLRGILEAWRVLYPLDVGSPVRPSGLVVPRRDRYSGELAPRYTEMVRHNLKVDCKATGIRPGITAHAFRRTMISAAEDGGGRPEIVRKITHPKSSKRTQGAYGVYSLPEWQTLAAEVALIDYGVTLPWW